MPEVNVKILSETIRHYVNETKSEKPILSETDIITLCQSHMVTPPYIVCFSDTNYHSFLIATDHIRSIPLFYLVNNEELFISDLVNDILPYSNLQFDESAAEEFLLTGYTTGSSTLIDDIKQLQAGEYLFCDESGIKTGFYTRFLTNYRPKLPFHAWKTKLKEVIDDVFSTLVRKLNGRTIVIPLSGGYDSRLIAYMLHKLKYPNIICFTYGRTNNCEVNNARETAKKLGLPWHFIDYTKLDIERYLDSDIFQEYYSYMANYSSMFFMQEYFAIKYLNENSLIPPDAVFIPGHSGDGLAGSHLNPRLGKELSTLQVAHEIFQFNYNLTEYSENTKSSLLLKLGKSLPEGFSSYLLFEDWDIRERQAKFIVNSARIFPFFKYDYIVPLWDIRLVDFFKTVPFELKLYKKLYKATLEEFFQKDGLLFQNEIQASPWEYGLHNCKQLLSKRFPGLKRLKPLPKHDSICYREITSVMIKDLKNNHFLVREAFGYNSFIVQWYLAKVKGKCSQ